MIVGIFLLLYLEFLPVLALHWSSMNVSSMTSLDTEPGIIFAIAVVSSFFLSSRIFLE